MFLILQPYGKPKLVSGGTTRPWYIYGLNKDHEIDRYVVKLFTKRDIGQTNYVAKELMGTLIVNEFDLNTPMVSFFDFANADLSEYSKAEVQQLSNAHPGLKFASKSLHPCIEMSQGLQNRYLEDFEVASIFCLDVLIWNSDRNARKPNCLYKNGKVWLIDHEKAFPDKRFEENRVEIPGFYKDHIFYKKVKQLVKKKGNELFDTFEYYLRNLDLRTIEAGLTFLEEHGMDVTGQWRWIEYLRYLKQESHLFVRQIKKLVQ